MSINRDPDRTIADWLDDGPDRLPPVARQVVVNSIHLTPQRRKPLVELPWRTRSMNGNAWRILTAAVVVVIGIGAGAVFLGTGGQPTASPTATATPALTATPAPTSSPIPFPTSASGISPGTYALELSAPSASTGDPVQMRITFTVADFWARNLTPTTLWQSDGRRIGFLTVDNVVSDRDPCAAVPALFEPPIGPTVADLVAALTSMSSVTTADPRDVDFAGFRGVEVQSVAADAASCVSPYQPIWVGPQGRPDDHSGLALQPNERAKLLILDVGGARLVVETTADRAASSAELAELQDVLDSVRIEVIAPTPSTAPAS